jgi:hypothetical protein
VSRLTVKNYTNSNSNTALYNRYQDCPSVNTTILSYLQQSTNYTTTSNKTTKFNTTVEQVAALETDFQCAGYCTDAPARYRAFSEVRFGPVAHNCTHNINKWAHETSSSVAGAYWTFFGVTIFCASYIFAFACRKEHEMNSPLLAHHNQH